MWLVFLMLFILNKKINMNNSFLLFFLIISSALVAQEKINLELNVFNEFTNDNISFADVRVVNTTTNQKLSKKTNFNGNVRIDLFPNMNYKLTVTAVSDSNIVIFKDKTMDFNTQGVQSGTNIEYEAKLRPIFQKGGLKFIQDIKFDIFTYTLDKNSKIILENVVDLLTKNPEIELEVNGYASCNLTEDDANSVSVERAKAVFSFLTSSGINYERIKAAAWGKEKNNAKCTCEPIKPKDNLCTKKDHLKNSKVTLDFTGLK